MVRIRDVFNRLGADLGYVGSHRRRKEQRERGRRQWQDWGGDGRLVRDPYQAGKRGGSGLRIRADASPNKGKGFIPSLVFNPTIFPRPWFPSGPLMKKGRSRVRDGGGSAGEHGRSEVVTGGHDRSFPAKSYHQTDHRQPFRKAGLSSLGPTSNRSGVESPRTGGGSRRAAGDPSVSVGGRGYRLYGKPRDGIGGRGLHSIYIGNLNCDVDFVKLWRVVSRFGRIANFHFPRFDPRKMANGRYAFFRFYTWWEALFVTRKMNNVWWLGRRLRVAAARTSVPKRVVEVVSEGRSSGGRWRTNNPEVVEQRVEVAGSCGDGGYLSLRLRRMPGSYYLQSVAMLSSMAGYLKR